MKKIIVPIEEKFGLSAQIIEYIGITVKQEFQIVCLYIANPVKFRTKEEFHLRLNQLVENNIRPIYKRICKSNPNLKALKVESRGQVNSVDNHIVEFANLQQADFIVMVSQSFTSELKNLWHQGKNITLKVIEKAGCPVFSFSSIPANARFQSIIIPVDDHNNTALKLEEIIEIASFFEAGVTLYSSVKGKSLQRIDQLNKLHREAESRLLQSNIMTEHFMDEQFRTEEGLLKCAVKRNISMIILQTRPYGYGNNLPISPETKKIVNSSAIPVLCLASKSEIVGLESLEVI